MPSERWHPIGSEELFDAIDTAWTLAESILPRTFPAGITKYRSFQELKRHKAERAMVAQAEYWRRQGEGAAREKDQE